MTFTLVHYTRNYKTTSFCCKNVGREVPSNFELASLAAINETLNPHLMKDSLACNMTWQPH